MDELKPVGDNMGANAESLSSAQDGGACKDISRVSVALSPSAVLGTFGAGEAHLLRPDKDLRGGLVPEKRTDKQMENAKMMCAQCK